MAQNSPPETQFLHYYKVVEFFFPRANQHFSEMNRNNEKDDKSKIFNKQRLIYLLNMPKVKEKACYVADSDFFLEILERKKKIGYSNLADELAKELYNYRNQVVHSMENTRKIPKLLVESHDYEAMEWWNKTIQAVAFAIIKCLCYDNNLDLESYD